MSPYKEAVSCVSRSLPVPLPSCAPFAEESWYFGTAAPASFLLLVYFWRMTIFAPIRELCRVIPPPCSRQRLPLAGSPNFPHSQTMLLLQEINMWGPYHQGLARPCPHLWQEAIWLWLRVDLTTHARSFLKSEILRSHPTHSLNKSSGSHCAPTIPLQVAFFLCFGTSFNHSFFLMMVHLQVPVIHLPSLGTMNWELCELGSPCLCFHHCLPYRTLKSMLCKVPWAGGTKPKTVNSNGQLPNGGNSLPHLKIPIISSKLNSHFSLVMWQSAT